ncbi:MAG: Ig-like domain repeat protein, partial [Psychrobium sp.]
MYSLNLENNAEVVGLSGVVNISADNQLHHVEIGTKLLKSDTLIMEENASVTIQYTDGSIVTYDQEAPSVQDELPDEFNEEEAAEETSIQDEIQAIQDAIASGGGDIETPATASGGNESQGGISFVSVERDDNTSIIGTDFSSEGLDTSTADSVDTPEIESNSADFIPDSEISLSTSINPSTGLVFVSGIVTNAGPNPVVTLTITDASGTNAPIVVSDVPVAPDGSYSIDSVNISALAEGQLTVNVSVTDDNAQTSEAETNFTYDVSAPNSPLFSISAGEDGVINAQEKEDGVTITVALNTDDVAVGDVVTITYAASPDSPQSITVTQEMLDNVPPQVVFTVPSEVIINNESLEGSITITDSSNNTSAPSTFSHSVDTIAPGDGETVSAPLVTITGTEGGITADEVTQGLLVNVTPPNGSAPGDTIKLTIAPTEPGAAPVEVIQQIPADWTEGTPIPVIVNKENIPSNGDYEITAIVSDPFGNQSDASTPTPVTFDAQTPIVVVPESEDGINAQEAQDGIQLTITAPASAQPGDIITIAFKSTTPGAETPTDEVVIIPPNWDGISPISSQIPADKIINQGVNNIEVSVTSSTTTAVAPVTIDTLAPGATVTPSSPIVEIPESTDSITAEELKNGIDVLVTPPADTAPGDTITVSISPGGENGEILITQEVPSDWNGITPISVLVPALPPMTDGEQEVTTYVTDTAGNKGQETKQSITVDTDSDVPTIFIPEAENGINAEEAADGISIFINPPNGAGVGYNVIVELLQDGNQIIELSEVIPSDWDGVTPILITVPKADVPEDGSYTVTAIVKHPFFGPAGGLAKEDGIVIDTTAPGTNGTPIAPTLEIPEATNGIDANELLDGVQVTLTIPSDSKPGDKVIFTIKSEENGQELTFESVIPNSWTPGKELSIDIPPTSFSSSGNHNITALVEDIVGNKGQESTPETVILNLSSSQPVVSIAEAENGINKAEALDGIEVVVIAPTGTSPGDTITLSFTKDGEDTAVPITFTVPNDWNGLSPISHNIEPNDIPSDGYYTVITTVTNPEGQKVGDSSTPQTIEIDTVAPGEEGPITQPLIEIPEASEGINAEEAKDGIQVLVKAPSGTIPGDTITLTVESNDGGEPIVVNHTIEDTWNGTDKIKVSISPDEMPKSGQHNISAVVTDNVGNSSEPSTPVTIEIDTESTSPTIFIEEALNSINAAEISDGIQIKVNTPTGTQGGDEITITITSLESGQELSETFTIPNNWDGTSLIDVTFPADKRPPDGDHDIQAVVRRPGQSFIGQPSEKETINIDTVAPGEGTSDPRPGINIPDIDGPFVNKNDISGGLQVLVTPPEGSLIGDTVEVRLYDKGGNLAGTFESIIPNDWELGNAVEIFVSANALRPDGEFSIDAVVIDLAGNPSLPTTSVDFEVDATAPGDGEEFSAPQLVIEEAKSGINKEEIADGIQTELSLPGGTKIGDTIIYTITSRADNSVETLEIAVNSSHFNDSGDLIRPTLITIEESLVPNDGEYNVIVHVKDPAGNLSEGSENVQLSIDTVAPGENTDQPNTFNRIPEAQDGINAEELSDGVEVFVTVPKGSNPGDTIVINIQKSGSNDDNLYDFEIPANWIPGNEISVLVDKGRFPVDGEYDISSSVYDQHGNQSKVSEVTVVTVDTKAPGEGFGPLVKLPENTDGVINKDEAEDGIDVRVTPPEGSQPGDKVVLTVVKEDGTPVSIEYVIPEEWQEPDTIPFTLPATVLPGDGNYKISATVIDKAGNESESSKIIDFELNTKEPGIEPTPITAPTVAVVDATDDGEINAQEFTAASGVSVEVGLPADAQVGDVITLTLTNDSDPAVADTYEHTVTQADVDAKSVNVVVSEFDDKPIADDIYAASATVTRGTDISPATNPAVTFDLDTTAPGAGAGPDGEDVGPTIAIPEQENDDEVTLEEASDGVVVNVKLPAGTEEGDTITLSITKPNGEVVDVEHTIESLPAEQTDGVNVTIPVEVISED